MQTKNNTKISEQTIHKTVIEWVRLHPSISPFVIHIPNEGKRSARYGKLLKDMGMRPGVWDLFIAIPNHGFHGAWIELKSINGKLTPLQKEFGFDMARQDYCTCVAKTVDFAIDFIKWYCF